jgi:hypothetical protein
MVRSISRAAACVIVAVLLVGVSSAFAAEAPTISAVRPSSGPASGGQAVVVTGSGFSPGATTVTFNGHSATVVHVVNPTTVIAMNPAATIGSVAVAVRVAGVSSNTLGYTYTDGPPVPRTPTVDSVDPENGPAGGGTTVTVAGTGLVSGQTSVLICGGLIPADQVAVNEAGTVATWTTPACSGGDTEVRVVTPGGVSNGLTFTYDGGGLPITGASVSIALLVGVSLLSIGLLIVVAVWRRKDRIP